MLYIQPEYSYILNPINFHTHDIVKFVHQQPMTLIYIDRSLVGMMSPVSLNVQLFHAGVTNEVRRNGVEDNMAWRWCRHEVCIRGWQDAVRA